MVVCAEISVNMLIRSLGILVVCAWMGFTTLASDPGSPNSPIEQVERDITDATSRGE